MHHLTTQRLILRPPREADASVMFDRWTRAPEVTRYLPWQPHATVDQTAAFVRGCIAAFDEGKRLPFL